jgi:hypothetical protein
VTRQKVLVLYLANSALDAPTIAWAVYDGTGEKLHMAGDNEEVPYATGLAALKDGWRGHLMHRFLELDKEFPGLRSMIIERIKALKKEK